MSVDTWIGTALLFGGLGVLTGARLGAVIEREKWDRAIRELYKRRKDAA